MSRYREGDDDWDDDAEDPGERTRRWLEAYAAALASDQGRAVLAAMKEALLALPEKRLIGSAVCTVGGTDSRIPAMTDEEFAARRDSAILSRATIRDPEWPRKWAEMLRECNEEEREKLGAVIAAEGEGVCGIGAYLWHQKVKAGMDPAEAFAAIPTVFDGSEDSSDPLEDTARLGEQAGIAYELAWELAYRNDETYERMTPEERYTAFLAWIDAELATEGAS